MVGHVLNRVRVAVEHISNGERIFLAERIDDHDRERAGKTLVSIRTAQGEDHGISIDRCFPHQLVKADVTAVETRVAEVGGKLVFHAVEREPRILNAVGYAPDGCAEEHEVLLIFLNRVVTEYDVYKLPLAVWHKHGLPGCAVVEQAYARAGGVGDGIAKHRLAGGQVPKLGNGNAHLIETSQLNQINKPNQIGQRAQYLIFIYTMKQIKQDSELNICSIIIHTSARGKADRKIKRYLERVMLFRHFALW